MPVSLFTALGAASWLLFSLGGARLAPQRRQDDSQEVTYTGCDDSVFEDDATICGAIVCEANEGYFYFYAHDALKCLATVPFDPSVALRFIDYYNTTMQFQSTLAFLRSPPAEYQQPPVDFFQELANIKNNVTEGRYSNEYAFEVDVMRLVYLVHDSHVTLYSGALSAFTFGSDYQLVAASIDGKEAPKIYMQTDVIQYRDTGATISAVATIDGVDVVQYLTEFAALNSVGMLEPHADWNQLMASPVQSILDTVDVFSSGATFYPGDNLTITLEDGTHIDDNWIAIYTNAEFTGPLSTGGDFYNYFVLDLLPDSYTNATLPAVFNYSSVSIASSANSSLQNWSNTTGNAYPSNATVVQTNLATGGLGGWITGYLLDDISTGVLSIPSFSQFGNDTETFNDAIGYFIQNMTNDKVQNVIIDLQGNLGGDILLALATFNSFFPDLNQFAGSRRRIHPLADIVGNATTQWWNGLSSANDFDSADPKYFYAGNEWVVTDRLNAETNQNFSSWDEYRGSVSQQQDTFSLVERYDLNNILFQASFFNGWYTTPSSAPERPWQPEEIVLLTDGQCASACALFVEAMSHQAGVRSVVMGGRPEAGPMQAASGSRGAFEYSGELLDADFLQTNNITGNATASVLPALDDYGYRDTGIAVTYAGLTLRDQVRSANASAATPLQFSYLAADCRLYYTLANVYNMTQLWHDVHSAAWTDSTLCVANSTGFSTTGNTTAANAPPTRNAAASDALPLPDVAFAGNLTDFTAAAGGGDSNMPAASKKSVHTCTKDSDCGEWQCYGNIEVFCNQKGSLISLCLPPCANLGSCPVNLQCAPVAGLTETRAKLGRSSGSSPVKSGVKSASRSGGLCVPSVDGSQWGLCTGRAT